MSDREGIAQVAQVKWANEQFTQKGLAKKSKIIIFSMFLLFKKWTIRSFPLFVSESLRSLTKNEWCERIAQVTHQKWVTSELLIFERITHLLIFSQKTSDLIENWKFPALPIAAPHVRLALSRDTDKMVNNGNIL